MRSRTFLCSLFLLACFAAGPLLAQEVVLSTPLHYRGFDPAVPLLTVQGSGNQTSNITEYRDRTTGAAVTWMDFGGRLNTVLANISAQWLNNICMVDANTPGADAGAKIAYCRDRLPSTGGTIDARGLLGAQSAATQINITKPNVTLELSPTTVLTVPSGVGSTSGIYITGNSLATGGGNNIRLLCNGATIKATRALENVAFDEYYLVRVTALTTVGVDGFVSDGCNYELTVTGALAAGAEMGAIKLESTATTRFVTNWSIRHNKFNTQAPDIGLTHKWYGVQANPTSIVANTRVFFDGKFEFNECLGDGRCLQVGQGRNISWIGNQARNPSQGNVFGGVQFRAIGVDNAVFVGNSCLVNTGNGGAACIYIGGNQNYANDESKGFSVTANVAKYDTVQLSGDTYGVNILGARDGTITGNTFVNTQAGAGGASDGIKVQAMAGLINRDINFSSNRIVGFLGYEILVSDVTPPVNLTAQGNHLGDSAAGGVNAFGGAGIANLRQCNNTTNITFATLGTPANGSFGYCSDCTIANPCAAAGTGAFAKYLNAVWVCN